VNYTSIEMDGFSSQQKSWKRSGRVHTTPLVRRYTLRPRLSFFKPLSFALHST